MEGLTDLLIEGDTEGETELLGEIEGLTLADSPPPSV